MSLFLKTFSCRVYSSSSFTVSEVPFHFCIKAAVFFLLFLLSASVVSACAYIHINTKCGLYEALYIICFWSGWANLLRTESVAFKTKAPEHRLRFKVVLRGLFLCHRGFSPINILGRECWDVDCPSKRKHVFHLSGMCLYFLNAPVHPSSLWKWIKGGRVWNKISSLLGTCLCTHAHTHTPHCFPFRKSVLHDCEKMQH